MTSDLTAFVDADLLNHDLSKRAEIALPATERRGKYAAVDPHADTGAHPILRDQAETETTLTAVEREALDDWANDLLDDQLPAIRADTMGCCAVDTGMDGGVRPAPVRLGFWFWAGLFLRATWPVVVLAVVFAALWWWHARHAVASAS